MIKCERVRNFVEIFIEFSVFYVSVCVQKLLASTVLRYLQLCSVFLSAQGRPIELEISR